MSQYINFLLYLLPLSVSPPTPPPRPSFRRLSSSRSLRSSNTRSPRSFDILSLLLLPPLPSDSPLESRSRPLPLPLITSRSRSRSRSLSRLFSLTAAAASRRSLAIKIIQCTQICGRILLYLVTLPQKYTHTER